MAEAGLSVRQASRVLFKFGLVREQRSKLRQAWMTTFAWRRRLPKPRWALAKNTWGQKLKRTITGFLQAAPNRRGSCLKCGACCKLMFRCPFLSYDGNSSRAQCPVYRFRPPACRKYPRVEGEQVCFPCGYYFV